VDTCDEEGRKIPKILRTVAACSCATSRKAANASTTFAEPVEREYYA
jgi:hypothetical protein